MDNGTLARRIVHLSAPAFLVYYFLPTPLWEGGPTPQVALLAALALTMSFELARLVIGFRVPGMRSYERKERTMAMKTTRQERSEWWTTSEPANRPRNAGTSIRAR